MAQDLGKKANELELRAETLIGKKIMLDDDEIEARNQFFCHNSFKTLC
jgi:hypothetical protein